MDNPAGLKASRVDGRETKRRGYAARRPERRRRVASLSELESF